MGRAERGQACKKRRHQMATKKTPMTQQDASRIQSNSDRTGKNQDFKKRAQRAAASRQSDSEQTTSTSQPPTKPSSAKP